MVSLTLPQPAINQHLQGTWATRLELMAEVSCNCLGHRKDGFTTTGVDKPFLSTGVHAACGKPTATVLAKYVNECDNCERWYISNELPDRWLNCSGCL